MNHIFISYSRKDQEKIKGAVERLRASGIEIWQDVSGDRSGIPYSVKWYEAIEEAVFTASAAIIFKSSSWEHSVPCLQEYQLFMDTGLPFMYIQVAELQENEKAVADQSAHWCRKQTLDKKNGLCRWMLTGARRLYKGLPVEIYFPKGRHFLKNLQWVKQCYDILDWAEFHGSWVESLPLFLKKARQKIILDFIKKVAIGTTVIVIFVFGQAYWQAIEMSRNLNIAHATESALINKARRLSVYDPLSAMAVLDGYGTQRESYVERVSDYALGIRMLAELVSRNYPSEYYGALSECPVDISGISDRKSNDRFLITLSDRTSQVFIYDWERDITDQISLDAVPQMYCFNEEGTALSVATENKVYFHDLYGNAEPFLLSCNYEGIRGLSMQDGKIYATTENDHVIVWDDPVLERKITDRNIRSGKLARTAYGREMAVYADETSLILNIDNKETVYPLSFEGTIKNDHIAVSPDGAYAAVVYTPEDSGSARIGMVNLSNGLSEREYDIGCSAADFIFSEDGTSLIVTCYDKQCIERIDIETGAIQESTDKTYSNPYTLIEYGDMYLVCDNVGALTIYDNALEQVGDYRSICEFRMPLRQLAVSTKYDCLFMAGRSGNLSIGNYMVHLSSDEQEFIPPAEGETMAATTAVTVTEDGEYVVFGNPDGSIYLWDIGTLNQVWNVQSISETVIDMSFSEDSMVLYALGSSGTIYPFDLSEVLSETIPADSGSIWEMLERKSAEVMEKMRLLEIPLTFD